MSLITQVKTTFTAGEVSRALLGRGDLRAYENGALTLRNVFIQPTGGVSRRAGLCYIDEAEGDGRLISFEFSTEQTYLLVLTHHKISIYADGVYQAELSAPWEEEQIRHIAWTQSADTLLLVHPDLAPLKLTRNSGGSWGLSAWSFITEGNVIRQPYFKFAGPDVTITPSGTSGSVTLTASASVFSSSHVGTRLRVGGKEVSVTAFSSATVLSATVIQTLSGTSATNDWQEQAFSAARGYPVSVAFHQDRLVIGGSRDLPNRLWFSRSGDLFNFDLGTGLDDEAIEFAILSDQVNAIRGIFSGRHLQVFTSGAEWMVTGDPLTPANVQIRRQTRIGSVVQRYIPPITVDGATLFVARNGEQIQEFLYTDIEQAYQVTDLALVSRHIIPTPVDMDFDQRQRLLFVVRDDGRFATLTAFRSEEVAAWTLHETQGFARSVSVVGDDVYMLLQRGDIYTIEQFDPDFHVDGGLGGESEDGTADWAGLDHLEGCTVAILADGIVQESQVVTDGEINLPAPAHTIQVGLPFTHIVEPLPPGVAAGIDSLRAVRLVEAVFRVEGTAALRLDVGRGLKNVTLRRLNGEGILDAPSPVFSGDVRVRALGWKAQGDLPLWRIEQDAPLPFTLLSVMTELKVSN